jgi:PAS domain S-box-containing protein
MRLGVKDYVLKTNLSRLCPVINSELKDIEYRKKQMQMEEILRAEEQRFRALVEHSSDIIVVLNLQGTITYINPAVEQVLGFKPEERIGKKGFEFVHPNDVGFLAESFDTLIRDTNSPVIHREMHLRHKNGSWRTLEAVGSNLINDNVVEAVIVNYRDITERKESEWKLRAEEQRFKALAEQSSDIILLINKERTITYENPAVERILGFKIKERIGNNAFENIHPYDLNRVKGAFSAFIGEKDAPPRHSEIRIRSIDGNWHTFESISSHLTMDNDIDEIIINLRDITERKHAEELLKQSEAKYHLLADHMKDQVWLMNLDLKFTYISPSVKKLWGYTLEELMETPLDKLLTEASFPIVIEFFSIEMPRALAAIPPYSLKRRAGLAKLDRCISEEVAL